MMSYFLLTIQLPTLLFIFGYKLLFQQCIAPFTTKSYKTLSHEHQWCLHPAPIVFMLRTTCAQHEHDNR